MLGLIYNLIHWNVTCYKMCDLIMMFCLISLIPTPNCRNGLRNLKSRTRTNKSSGTVLVLITINKNISTVASLKYKKLNYTSYHDVWRKNMTSYHQKNKQRTRIIPQFPLSYQRTWRYDGQGWKYTVAISLLHSLQHHPLTLYLINVTGNNYKVQNCNI